MTAYNVTITFTLEGAERHAFKLAEKVEDVVAASKRVVADDAGGLVQTEINEVGR